jgi:hypothetical protein
MCPTFLKIHPPHIQHGYTLKEIADHLEIHDTTLSTPPEEKLIPEPCAT